MTRIAGMTNWMDDRMNPIVVKELRQGMQSRSFIVIVNLLLAALTLICMLSVMTNPEVATRATGGRVIYGILQGALFFSCIVFVPMYTLTRLRSERSENNVDLFFTTTLKPTKIVRGKFFAGLSLVTMLYSVCVPFMLFTYMLRGFDIPTMLLSLGIGYLVTALALAAAIVVGCWSPPKALGQLVVLASAIGLMILAACVIGPTSSMLMFGIGTSFRDPRIFRRGRWGADCVFLLAQIARIHGHRPDQPGSKQPHAPIADLGIPDDSRHVRRDLGGGLVFVLVWRDAVPGCVPDGLCPMDDCLALAGDTYASDRCLRARRLFQTHPPGEAPRFPRRDKAGGLPLHARRLGRNPLVAVSCRGDYRHFLRRGCVEPHRHNIRRFLALRDLGTMVNSFINESVRWMLLACLFQMNYILLGKILMRAFFPPSAAKHTWVAVLFALFGVLMSTLIITFAMDPRHWDRSFLWNLVTPFASIHHSGDTLIRFYFAALWGAVVLLICLPRALRDFGQYQMGEPIPQAEPDQPVTPIVVAEAAE